ncbi:chlorophyllase-1 [Trifolium pratense]|uniref:chlorophyllase-1 n=1 Tax=Trifolium pratense TaxID=57577 RepID=UPI001E6909DF|nr:chlorophyllase-1 [Trifolium pratense]
MASPNVLSTTIGTNVFQIGNIKWKQFNVDTSPKPLLVFTPTVEGTYPVILFCHGFAICNSYYSKLLGHITSHGFIVVAPQLFTLGLPMPGLCEVKFAGKVANWIAGELQPKISENVQENVQAKLDTIVLAGHSKGGKTAFAVALGHAETTLKFSSLIGIDPVAGPSKCKITRTLPHILTGKAQSFDLNMPVVVIGTGLGPETGNCFPIACAPDGVNHEEFFYECKPPCAHFVTKDYGHMDMLDDDVSSLLKCMCKNGIAPKDLTRRTLGGLVVAFLKAYLYNQWEDFKAILEDPNLARAKLEDPVFYP